MSEEGQRLCLGVRSSDQGVEERRDGAVIHMMRGVPGIRLSNPFARLLLGLEVVQEVHRYLGCPLQFC